MIYSEQIKVVGFTLGSPGDLQGKLTSLILFEVGEIKYEFSPNISQSQLITGEHSAQLRWVELAFDVMVNYIGSQLNNGANYTLPNGYTIQQKPNTDFVTLANRLLINKDLHFFPRLVTGDNTVDLDTYYKVTTAQKTDVLINAKRAGFYNPATPLRMKVTQPLTEYPTWIKHKV